MDEKISPINRKHRFFCRFAAKFKLKVAVLELEGIKFELLKQKISKSITPKVYFIQEADAECSHDAADKDDHPHDAVQEECCQHDKTE